MRILPLLVFSSLEKSLDFAPFPVIYSIEYEEPLHHQSIGRCSWYPWVHSGHQENVITSLTSRSHLALSYNCKIARHTPLPISKIIDNSLQIDQPSRSLPLGELLSWVRGNGLRLVQLLEQRTDPSLRLPSKLSHLLNLSIEPEHIYATLN